MSAPDPADQRLFVVSDDQMDALEAALSRPPVVKPRLAALLSEVSPLAAPNDEDER